MVKIRLKRMGTTKRPVYRIVVADSRSPRDGRFIEAIGFYDPLPNPAVVRIDEEKVRVWMRKGARPSESARFLLVQQGILAPLPRRERPATRANGDGVEVAGSKTSTPVDAAGDAGGAEPGLAIPEEPAGGDPEAAGPAASPEAEANDGAETAAE